MWTNVTNSFKALNRVVSEDMTYGSSVASRCLLHMKIYMKYVVCTYLKQIVQECFISLFSLLMIDFL